MKINTMVKEYVSVGFLGITGIIFFIAVVWVFGQVILFLGKLI